MTNVFEAHLIGTGLKVGVVVGRFNEFITTKLLRRSIRWIKASRCRRENIDIAWVPGAFEIPLIAKKMADSGKYDAIIGIRYSNSRCYNTLRLRM